MDNKDLEWISDVIDKLQVPQTHNERQRLTKILERVAPALIKVLDYTTIRDGNSEESCRYEELLQLLKEEQKKEK